jgi:hypothetical protein
LLPRGSAAALRERLGAVGVTSRLCATQPLRPPTVTMDSTWFRRTERRVPTNGRCVVLLARDLISGRIADSSWMTA